MKEEKKFKKFMKGLQPGKNDLKINQEWGIPLSKFTKIEANEKGLKKWNHRWVSPEEIQELKPQYKAYRRIKSVAVIVFLIGFYVLGMALEKFEVLPSSTRGLVAIGSAFLYPCFHFIVGFGIYKYKNWARWIATFLFPLLIPPRTFYVYREITRYQQDQINTHYAIVFIFFVFMMIAFFSKKGKIIFKTSSK